VKIHTTRDQFPMAQIARERADPYGQFCWAWLDAHVSPAELDFWWTATLENAWDRLDMDTNADNIFGRPVQVISEGRSGGWALIEGMDEAAARDWTLDDLARWERFAELARATADDVPYHYLDALYENVYLPAMAAEHAAADRAQRFA